MIRNTIILLLSLSFGGIVTDIDGNVYETVQISYEVMFRDYNNVEISINKIVNGLMVVTP